MIEALISGKLIADPERRTGANGKGFTTFRLAAGTDDESVFVSGIAFGTAAEQIAALAKGDTVAVAGRCKPKAWVKDGEPKAGLDVVAAQVLSLYHLEKRRKAVQQAAPARETAPAARRPRQSTLAGTEFDANAEDERGLQGDIA